MYRLFAFIILITLSGCTGCKSGYTFLGGSLGDAKTVSIKVFPNNAPLIQPTLSQAFTEALRDLFISQARLNLVTEGGDFHFEGAITNYAVAPVAITGNQTAALNRLTISVNVRFTNKLDDTKSFDQTFSRFADWQSSIPLASVEQELISDINKQLVQDVFNKAVINW
jgi:hypothetical protein